MIRKIRYKDIEAVNMLLDEAFSSEYEAKGINTKRRVKFLKKVFFFLKILSIFPNIYSDFLDFYVYEWDKKIVGLIRILKISSDVWTFDTTAVDKKYRKRGIAETLNVYCTKLCKKKGAKCIILTVKDDNLPSLSLVRKKGFVEYGKEVIFILNDIRDYKNHDLKGFRKRRINDSKRILELERKVVPERLRAIDGEWTKETIIDLILERIKFFFLKEQIFEYVLEKNNKLIGYMRVSDLLDGSTVLDILIDPHYPILTEKFVEKVMYLHGKKRSRVMLYDLQYVEKSILRHLGFEKFNTLIQFRKEI